MQANEAAREVQAQQMMERLSAAAEQATRSASGGAAEPSRAEGNGSQPHSTDDGNAAARPLVVLCGDFNDSPSSAACQVSFLSCGCNA